MTGERRDDHLFIVGVGRSGTSLLQSMLNAHSMVSFTPEIHFIRRFLASNTLEKVVSSDAAAAAGMLASDEFVARLGFDAAQLREAADALGHGFSSRALYVALQRMYADAQGKGDARWLGDKDPRSIEYLPMLSRLFPEMRALHIMRDPRDVLASKKKAAWSKDGSVLRHIFANRVQLKMGRRYGRLLLGPRYMEVVYEELLGNPRDVLERVCAFLELDFEEAMLEFAESSKRLVSESEMQWKKETLGPLLSSNSGKWKKSLTPWEAALTERACADAMHAAGYEASASTHELGLAGKAALMTSWGLLAAGDPVYRLYRQLETRS